MNERNVGIKMVDGRLRRRGGLNIRPQHQASTLTTLLKQLFLYP